MSLHRSKMTYIQALVIKAKDQKQAADYITYDNKESSILIIDKLFRENLRCKRVYIIFIHLYKIAENFCFLIFICVSKNVVTATMLVAETVLRNCADNGEQEWERGF